MTLHPARFPTHFEGEIECAIDWYTGEEDKMEMRSMHTNTNVNENQEHLFLRLKKRTKFVSIINLFSLIIDCNNLFEYYRQRTLTQLKLEKMKQSSPTY